MSVEQYIKCDIILTVWIFEPCSFVMACYVQPLRMKRAAIMSNVKWSVVTMNESLLKSVDRLGLNLYRWGFAIFTVAVISGSTVFGLYDKNYHGVLHLLMKHYSKAILTLVGVGAVVSLMIFLVNKLSKYAAGVSGDNLLTRISEYLYAKVHRLFLFLLVIWAPISISIFPGAAGWDLAMQAQEVIDSRAAVIANHLMAPNEVYPIANYLVQQGDGLLTNQHNFFLTLIYGGTLKYSLIWFHSYTPGLALLAVTQFLFTVLAFSISLYLIGKTVKNSLVKLISVALTGLIFVIPLSSWSLSKNPLFVAAVVLFVGLMVGILKEAISSGKAIVGFIISNLVILISVKYGWLIIAAEFLFLLFIPSMRKLALVSFLLPLLFFKVSMSILFATGTVIQDDPIESKGIQIQQVALYVQEYPNDLTKFETKELNRIFNVQQIAIKYNPGNTDSVKGSGYYDKDTYRYQTIRQSDWRNFNKVWLEMMIKHPSVFVRGAVLKFYGYFDVLSDQRRDMTVDYPDFELKKENMDEANINPRRRDRLNMLLQENKGILGLMNSGALYVIIGLIMLSVLNFKFGWYSLLISMPFYVQILAIIVSPLNASVRYSLGFIYGLPLLLMLIMADDVRNNQK